MEEKMNDVTRKFIEDNFTIVFDIRIFEKPLLDGKEIVLTFDGNTNDVTKLATDAHCNLCDKTLEKNGNHCNVEDIVDHIRRCHRAEIGHAQLMADDAGNLWN